MKYVKILLLLVVLIISLKPFLFTWNFIGANFQLKKDKGKAGAYMVRAVSYNSSAYDVFNRYFPMVMEHYLVKSAVYRNDSKQLQTYSGLIPLSKLQEQFKDNFYLGNLLGNLRQKRDWQHLDQVSFDLLKDPAMNQRTITIFEKIGSSFDQKFLKNLADFIFWQGNDPLLDHLLSTYPIGKKLFKSARLTGNSYDESVARLKKIMWQRYKLKGEFLGENFIQCPAFSDPAYTKESWYFSKMAGVKNFSPGSFFMGTDHSGKSKNPVIRLMGFFVEQAPGKSRPRAGVRSRQKIVTENGFYVFSFDYCTVTGSERPSFWLCRGIEKRLPHTKQEWKKVIFILNNAFNDYESLNPLLRMWGTGTVLVDNVFLSKITPMKFSISESFVLIVQDT